MQGDWMNDDWWLRVGEPQEEGYDVDGNKFSFE